MMGFMAGKRALIVGVASDRSIATGIAEAFAREGAEIAFTYQNDKLKGRVEKLANRLEQDTTLLFPCDVTRDEEIDSVFGVYSIHVFFPQSINNFFVLRKPLTAFFL